jgi:hypothetical protein
MDEREIGMADSKLELPHDPYIQLGHDIVHGPAEPNDEHVWRFIRFDDGDLGHAFDPVLNGGGDAWAKPPRLIRNLGGQLSWG